VNYAYPIGYALLNIDHMTKKAGAAQQNAVNDEEGNNW
jgi:hypothetical protein